MAKRHELKAILSNKATEKAVDSIWTKEVILDDSFYFNYNKAQRLVDACKDIRLKVH